MLMQPITIFDIHIAQPELKLVVEAHAGVLALIAIGLLVVFGFRAIRGRRALQQMEIDEAEFGIGNAKFKLKPNWTDRQVAYAIWVELSTRKIGIPIDFENDVVVDVYESWFNFFSVTRELVKTVPISRVTDASTQRIIRLSVEVLNEGLRPHLTCWHARFRRWYGNEEAKAENLLADPQDIQLKYPRWSELKADMAEVNERLIRYRNTMLRIVYGGAE
ncbi:MAG: hypothetical protein EPO30_11375, partial [Lysobacteraceae bacterium]